MLLAVNIGNCAVNLGVFDGSELICTFDFGTDLCKTADEYAMQINSALSYKGVQIGAVNEAIIGSVVPTLTERVEFAVSKLFGITAVTVRPGVKTGFKIRLNDPTELGADIAANAAGAIAACGAPVIICDAGVVTAVTVVDGSGNFLGGALCPGVGMSLKALSEAALLPSVGLADPRSPLGKTTAECMNAGVIYGQAATIGRFISDYKTELSLPDDTPVVITGEYSKKLSGYLDVETTVIPELTLKGLCAIYRNNSQAKRK